MFPTRFHGSDPAHDYDRYCDATDRAHRKALEEGRIFRCAGCGETHEWRYRTRKYKRPYRGRTERTVVVQPRELGGREYGAACFLAALAERKRGRIA